MDAYTAQTIPASLSITDSQGRPAEVDDVPVWASSDETVLTVEAEADGMTASIVTVAPGTARVTVHADADLGDGVVDLVGVSEDVTVTVNPNSMASVVTLELGAPVDN
jgi:hypothetical protein